MTKAVYSGVPFFVSQNRVVLSPGLGTDGYLETKYFRSVYDIKKKSYMY
jgi:hypothetical protein